jgi:FkbM family methyltransferase
MFGLGRKFKKCFKRGQSRQAGETATRANGMEPLYGDSYWYACNNLWEPPVLVALKDLCRPGMTVFDVGANMGGLTSAMSRLVGPLGRVCSFEASPRIIGHLQRNVVLNGHNNVTVHHRAVFSRSNELTAIYEGDHLNDSLYRANSPNGVGHQVKTLALDDFCEAAGLSPEVLKMDIEGAEYEALLGAERLLANGKPHLILEQTPGDVRCLEFLLARDYLALDSSTYEQIKSIADFQAGDPLQNIIFIHKSRLDDAPYRPPISRRRIQTLTPEDFRPNAASGMTSVMFDFQAGRYLLDLNFTARGRDNHLFAGVRLNGKDLFRYNAYSALLAQSYAKWLLDVPAPGQLSIYFEFVDGTRDDSLILAGGEIFSFEGLLSPWWSRLVLD